MRWWTLPVAAVLVVVLGANGVRAQAPPAREELAPMSVVPVEGVSAEEANNRKMRRIGLIVTGLGVALGAAGIGLGVAGAGALSNADRRATDLFGGKNVSSPVADPSVGNDLNRGQVMRTTAFVAGGVAVMAITAGLVLYLVHRRGPAPQRSAAAPGSFTWRF